MKKSNDGKEFLKWLTSIAGGLVVSILFTAMVIIKYLQNHVGIDVNLVSFIGIFIFVVMILVSRFMIYIIEASEEAEKEILRRQKIIDEIIAKHLKESEKNEDENN